MSNNASKTDLKKATGVDKSSFGKKTDLANLKSHVDKLYIGKLKHFPTNLSNFKSKVNKLDVDKLEPVSADLSELSNVVKNGDKIKLRSKILIPDITNLATKAYLKVSEYFLYSLVVSF